MRQVRARGDFGVEHPHRVEAAEVQRGPVGGDRVLGHGHFGVPLQGCAHCRFNPDVGLQPRDDEPADAEIPQQRLQLGVGEEAGPGLAEHQVSWLRCHHVHDPTFPLLLLVGHLGYAAGATPEMAGGSRICSQRARLA